MGFNGILVPDWAKPFVGYVVGTDWPEGDESGCFLLADACVIAAHSVVKGTEADQPWNAGKLGDAWDGAANRAFAQRVSTVLGGQVADLVNRLFNTALAFNNVGLQIQYAKYMIELTVGLLIVQIWRLVALARASAGATLALIPARLQVARMTIQQIARRVLANIALFGGIAAGMDAAAQIPQIIQGRRDGLDGHQMLKTAVTGGAMGGLMGALSGGLTRLGGSALQAGLSRAEMTGTERLLAASTHSIYGQAAQYAVTGGVVTAADMLIEGRFDWEMLAKGVTSSALGADGQHLVTNFHGEHPGASGSPSPVRAPAPDVPLGPGEAHKPGSLPEPVGDHVGDTQLSGASVDEARPASTPPDTAHTGPSDRGGVADTVTTTVPAHGHARPQVARNPGTGRDRPDSGEVSGRRDSGSADTDAHTKGPTRAAAPSPEPHVIDRVTPAASEHAVNEPTHRAEPALADPPTSRPGNSDQGAPSEHAVKGPSHRADPAVADPPASRPGEPGHGTPSGRTEQLADPPPSGGSGRHPSVTGPAGAPHAGSAVPDSPGTTKPAELKTGSLDALAAGQPPRANGSSAAPANHGDTVAGHAIPVTELKAKADVAPGSDPAGADAPRSAGERGRHAPRTDDGTRPAGPDSAPPPVPPAHADWRQQAREDLQWLRKVDPLFDRVLNDIALRDERGQVPGGYRDPGLEPYRDEVRAMLPREIREKPENRALVAETVETGARLLRIVDFQFSQGEGPFPRVGGTVWKDMPAANNNGNHTRHVAEDSVRYTMRRREADPTSYTDLQVAVNLVAALGHDVVQGHGRGFDERLAAAFTRRLMAHLMPISYASGIENLHGGDSATMPGQYVYDAIQATSFNQKEMRQNVNWGSTNVKGQLATAVADLFRLALAHDGPLIGAQIAIKDFSMPGGKFYVDLPGRIQAAGKDLESMPFMAMFDFIEHDEISRAMFMKHHEGQIWFTGSHEYPDHKVDEWFSVRALNLAFHTATHLQLEARGITVPEYYLSTKEFAFWADLRAEMDGAGHDPASLPLDDLMKVIDGNAELREAFVRENQEWIGHTGVPNYPDPKVKEWATLRAQNMPLLEELLPKVAAGEITPSELLARLRHNPR